MKPKEVRLESEDTQLVGVLYGELRERRAALLCHGANWDASGWADLAPRFVERDVPALALNFRGYDGSTGRTSRTSVVDDVRNAVAWLRTHGAREIALVGASMGGHAVLVSSAHTAPECVVAISAPVRPMSEAEVKRVSGRKLFVCAERDYFADAVRQAFEQADEPKRIKLFPGREHSRGMFRASYAEELFETVLGFVTAGLPAKA